MRAARRSTAPG